MYIVVEDSGEIKIFKTLPDEVKFGFAWGFTQILRIKVLGIVAGEVKFIVEQYMGNDEWKEVGN